MFLLQCNGCKTAVVAPDARDPDAAVTCPPESDCCKADHHHGEAANACPGDHDGGHGLGVDGCTVCRPITITALAGSLGVSAGTGA
jgi:hypothetical protein